MRRETLKIPNAAGDMLAARLDLPAGRPRAFALFAHCFTCSKDLRAVGRLTRPLVEAGIAVLRFDFTGLGQSEGEFADTTFATNLDDLVAAADFLRQEYEAPRILIGHSLGGAAVVSAAHRVPECVAVATLGAPSETAHLQETLQIRAPEIASRGEAQVTLAGRSFLIKEALLADLAQDRVRAAAAKLQRALLVMHSPVDETVGIEHARKLFDAAKHPKSFVSLDDADHLLMRRTGDAGYAGRVLAAWAGRYIEPVEAEARADVAAGEVVVRGGARGLANDVFTEHHDLRADEPESAPGGTDTGPSPYELLLASLGACTSMTLRMYAGRKEWPLEDIEVRLRHDRVHADDCAECETRQGKIDYIARELRLAGDLTAEQRQRLAEIADKCPVHRTLTTETVIETKLADT